MITIAVVQPDPPNTASTARPPSIRCLHCGYDLRGLPGDPVRCPECGAFTSYAEYSERTAWRSKAGDYSVCAALAFPVLCLSAVFFFRPLCAACGLLPTLVIWLVLTERVRRDAGGSANWFALFLAHQFLVLGLIVLVLIFVPMCIWLLVGLMHWVDATGLSHGPRELVGAAAGMLVVGLITAAFLWITTRMGNAARDKYERLNSCQRPHVRDARAIDEHE